LGGLGSKVSQFMDGADESDIMTKMATEMKSGSGSLVSGGAGNGQEDRAHINQSSSSKFKQIFNSDTANWMKAKGCCILSTAYAISSLEFIPYTDPGLLKTLEGISDNHINKNNGDVSLSFFTEMSNKLGLGTRIIDLSGYGLKDKIDILDANLTSRQAVIVLRENPKSPSAKPIGHYIAVLNKKGSGKYTIGDPERDSYILEGVGSTGVLTARYLIVIEGTENTSNLGMSGATGRIVKNVARQMAVDNVPETNYADLSRLSKGKRRLNIGGLASAVVDGANAIDSKSKEVRSTVSDSAVNLTSKLTQILEDGILIRGGALDHVGTTGVVGAVDQDLADSTMKESASKSNRRITGARAIQEKIRFTQKHSKSKHGRAIDLEQDTTHSMDKENNETLKKIAENNGGGNGPLLTALALGMSGMMSLMSGLGAAFLGYKTMKGGVKSGMSGAKDIFNTATGSDAKSGIGVAKFRLGKHMLTAGAKAMSWGKKMTGIGSAKIVTNTFDKLKAFGNHTDTLLKTVGKDSTASGLIPKLIKFTGKIVKSSLGFITKIIPGDMAVKLASKLTTITSVVGKVLGDGLAKVVKKGLGVIGLKNALGSTPLGWIAAGTMFLWDATQGWRNAHSILGITKGEPTALMKTCTALASGILSALSWVPGLGVVIAAADLMGFKGNKKLAEMLYEIFAKEDIKSSIRSRNEMGSTDDSELEKTQVVENNTPVSEETSFKEKFMGLFKSEEKDVSPVALAPKTESPNTTASVSKPTPSSGVAKFITAKDDEVYKMAMSNDKTLISFDSSKGKGGNIIIKNVDMSAVKKDSVTTKLDEEAGVEYAKNNPTLTTGVEASVSSAPTGTSSSGGSSTSTESTGNNSPSATKTETTGSTIVNNTGINAVSNDGSNEALVT
ncbi:MAG: hypothetical protein ACRC6R_08405, partial [Bacteroidales bacterium]